MSNKRPFQNGDFILTISDRRGEVVKAHPLFVLARMDDNGKIERVNRIKSRGKKYKVRVIMQSSVPWIQA